MEYGLVALWWLVYVVLLLAGLPIAAALLPRLADRGAGVALPTSLAILSVVAYWVGHVSFGLTALVAGLAVLVGLILLAGRFDAPELDRRAIGDTVGVFTVSYLLLVWIRSADPAITPGAGEKFLDFGMLNTLLRAETLPPIDFWFAGEPVQYYYGGHLIAALLTELTGTAPQFAYNLALAGFYAMTVTAAFGLAGSIAADRGHSRRLGGLIAAFLVGFASNLLTPLRTWFWLLPDAVSGRLADWLAYEPTRTALGPSHFFYWDASRIIDGTINEFPLFAFLNGDLHAHMMSMPFVLLVATLCYGYYRTPESAVWHRRVLIVGAVPIVAGLLALVNTWDLPIALGLAWLALALSPASVASLLPASMASRFDRFSTTRDRSGTGSSDPLDHLRGELRRVGLASAVLIVLVALSVLWFLPFFTGTASGRGVGFFPGRSALGQLFVVHGAFLVVFWLYLVERGLRTDRRATLLATGIALLAIPIGWALDLAAIGLFGPLLLAGWLLCRLGPSSSDQRSRPVGFETVLLVAGLGLVLIVEFAYVQEQAGPERLNTVFKTYAQVWLLWSTAAGAMIASLVSRRSAPASRDRLDDHSTSETEAAASGSSTGGSSRSRWSGPVPATTQQVLVVVFALLLVSTGFYGAFALGQHFEHAGDDRTLDGVAYVEVFHPEEAAAIAWLDAREGQPHLVSAPGADMYRWVNAPSSLTGVPTVAGWAHQRGYRSADVYFERVADVDAIYTGSDTERVALLSAYEVTYIYVGPVERERYGEELPAYEELDGVSVAFEEGGVTIYRVDRTALSAS